LAYSRWVASVNQLARGYPSKEAFPMLRGLSLLVPISLIVVLIAAACGGDGGTAAPAVAGQTGPAPASGSAAQGLLSTVDVVRKLTPSVVQIATESLAMDAFNEPVPSRGVGTGIVLDELGNILTNNHVIAGAQSITVTLSGGGIFPAQVVGGDASTDTAVIRIEAQGLQPAELGRSADLLVGEEVIAAGHALGLSGGPTVSKGVVSALGRSIDVDPQTTIVDLIQTDASINPGNSGGPLANTRGEVIGINSAGIRGSQGIGFAINIDDAKLVVAQLLKQGYVDRGFLGISPVNLTPSIANQVAVAVTEGILVARVVPDSPAANAGLQEQDVIVRLSDGPIRNNGELSKFLLAHPPGETVAVVFFRGSREITVRLTLGERPR
jgi:S1-C subfamily serine protease